MSAQLNWRTLDEAGEARTVANRLPFLPQALALSGQTFFWPRNLPQEAMQFLGPVLKKEIPAKAATPLGQVSGTMISPTPNTENSYWESRKHSARLGVTSVYLKE